MHGSFDNGINSENGPLDKLFEDVNNETDDIIKTVILMKRQEIFKELIDSLSAQNTKDKIFVRMVSNSFYGNGNNTVNLKF